MKFLKSGTACEKFSGYHCCDGDPISVGRRVTLRRLHIGKSVGEVTLLASLLVLCRRLTNILRMSVDDAHNRIRSPA